MWEVISAMITSERIIAIATVVGVIIAALAYFLPKNTGKAPNELATSTYTIERPLNKEYTLIEESKHNFQIVEVITRSESGSSELYFKINGERIIDVSQKISNEKNIVNYSKNNKVKIGDRLSIEIEKNSLCKGAIIQWVKKEI